MAKHQSAEEVKQEYIEKLGENLGAIYYRLWNELAFLHIKWSEFESLYGEEKNVTLMKSISPHFFFYLQNLLLEDVILGITRITENREYKGKPNLTIRQLPNLVDDSIKGQVGKLIKRIGKETDFCKDRRNRRIGHIDMNLALENQYAEPLKTTNRNKINQVLDSISELMNVVHLHYLDSTTLFRMPSQEGLSLLKHAERGILIYDLELKLLEEGKNEAFNEIRNFLNQNEN